MSKPAALPLFGDAYLADTTHLTTEEHGAYLLLMIAAWRQEDCSLPNDDRKLARIAGLSARKWGAIKETILEFWQIENGRIYQPRLTKEHDYVCKKSEANRKSAEARWNKQPIEKQQSDECERISERNAPPPPPIEDNTDVLSPPRESAKAKPRKASGYDPASVELPEYVNPKDWLDFAAMRAAIKKPIKTEQGARGLIAELCRLAEDGHPPGRVLRQSIAFEWQGLFPLKDQGNGNGRAIGNGVSADREQLNPVAQAIVERRAERAGEQPTLYE